MNGVYVLLQTAELAILSFAAFALERAFLEMDLTNMTMKITVRRQKFEAEFALERAFLEMDLTNMTLKTPFPRQKLEAEFAFESFFLCQVDFSFAGYWFREVSLGVVILDVFVK